MVKEIHSLIDLEAWMEEEEGIVKNGCKMICIVVDVMQFLKSVPTGAQ
jgi:hypothetical protein